MKKFIGRSVILLIAGLVLFNVLMFILQPGMLFYPYPDLESDPSTAGLSFENISIRTEDDVLLHAWYIPANAKQKVVLFFHGNAGNISHRIESLSLFNSIGLNVLIIDYRGYGRSKGSPGETGFYRDATAAWRYLTETKGFAQDDIIIFGRSLGGAVATDLAARVTPYALILESTFSSTRDMANTMMPALSHIIYMRYDFANRKRIKDVSVPVLVMHSPEDEIIPFQQGRAVFDAANSPKMFYRLKGDHNSGFITSMPYYKKILEMFLKNL